MNKNIEELKNNFSWGTVKNINSIGDYQIIEYEDDEKEIYYKSYVNFKDTGVSYKTLESALILAIAYNTSKNMNESMYATDFFKKMINK